ncbi:hypothetical protein JOM56_008196 [Amanita muscaria]
MLCNWPIVASNIFRAVARPTSVYNHTLQPLRGWSLPRTFATAVSLATSSSSLDQYTSARLATSSPPSLTDAQLSRAAHRAIHKCIQLHSFGDAYYIVNSLRFSNFQHKKSLIKFTGVRSADDFESAAMQFGRPVSPRLSSHALLHGLLRAGLTKKAYNLTRLMINDGIRLRSKTLEAVMHGFLPPVHSESQPARNIKSVPPHEIFKPQAKLAQDEGARMALSLLLLAQRSWHRRTRSMYKALLALCIINGELILGSLVFGYMIRDWQTQVALHTTPNQPAENSDVVQKQGQKCGSLLREPLRPSAAMLQSLLVGINSNLEHAAKHEEYQEPVQAALQALAIIVNLFDDRQPPVTGLSSLIRTISHIPMLDYHVWILADGKPKRKKAREYFHTVLDRFITNLPDYGAPEQRREHFRLQTLNLSDYNSLLNYALRHRLSSTLGSKVLNHMINGQSTLKPDIMTYNILIRSGTALRDSKIAEQALFVLRQNPKNNSVYVHEVPDIDIATICACVDCLTSVGRPHAAAQSLAMLLPELRTRRSRLSSEARKALQEEYMQRAVKLGPYIFTAIITALCKAGKIGLAERAWLVALSAEKASNDPRYGREPWVMPIHVCTAMMECYGAQMRKRDYVVGWARFLSAEDGARLRRRIAALRLAHMLYEYAKTKHQARGQLDARFLNASLKVFARHPQTGRSIVYRSARRRGRVASAQLQYAQLGRYPQFDLSMLYEVANDILDAGFQIPAAYRPFLIDRVSPTNPPMCPFH